MLLALFLTALGSLALTEASWVVDGSSPRINIIGGIAPIGKGCSPFGNGLGVVIPGHGELRQLSLTVSRPVTVPIVINPTLNGAKMSENFSLTLPIGEKSAVGYFEFGLPVSRGSLFNIISNGTRSEIQSAMVLASVWMSSYTPPV